MNSTTFIEMMLPLQGELAREYQLEKKMRKLEKGRAEKERDKARKATSRLPLSSPNL